jgi:hypothetical protein
LALAKLREHPRDRQAIEALEGFMETSRTRRLLNQLERYCNGQQDGVSILVSGTRGAGKTTMAKLVVQKLIANGEGLIPLPLFLHGPTFLRPDNEPDTIGTEERWWLSLPQSDLARKVALKKHVLRGLISALYQHLRDALVDAWEHATPQRRLWRHGRPVQELRQLQAHLDLKLDEAPSVATLRKIWRRAGLLQSGVAFQLYPRRDPSSPAPTDQGLREVVALAACALSYLTIIGATKETVSNTTATTTTVQTGYGAAPQSAAKEEKKETKPEVRGEGSGSSKESALRLAPAAFAAATTAVSAAGGKGEDVAWALLAGGFIYLLGLLSLRFGTRRDRLSDLRRDLIVEVDWTERRLEREFPALLRRVKHAGFAPIFVLDELDKLEDQAGTLNDFLDLAKHIVRDQAAFLFLTNRDYFEQYQSGLLPGDIPGAPQEDA